MSPAAPPTKPQAIPLLPPELPWLYLLVPLPAAFLMGHDELARGRLALPALLLALAKMYLPFLVYGGAFQLVYVYVMPRLLRGLTRSWQRIALHAAVMVTLVYVLSLPLTAALSHFETHRMQRVEFLIVSMIFSCAFILPSLAVQRLRARARTAEHIALMERKAALEAQLQALQARTDPHFLFNSLNTVASLIPEDPVLAERSLERLADLFRYALDSSRTRTVRLERELAMVSDYLELQSARFGSRLKTRLDVATDLGDIEVPPLLLQPLVENAILHGTAQRRGGRVEVVVRREQDSLVIEVSDDGPGPGASQHAGAGTALTGLIERLRLHYAERGSVSLLADPRGGCLARLLVPIGGGE
ncbi:MAG TPA: histidine kinase [Polyangiales bacterium]|nr:histidine kinase [Polyangiales bacterium]